MDSTDQDEAKLCQKRTGQAYDGSRQAGEKIPHTALSFAEDFPQTLPHAEKHLRQQQKIRAEQKQSFHEPVFCKSTRR